MRTNGLVWALALSLSIAGSVRAEGDETTKSDAEALKATSTDEMLNSDDADAGVVYFSTPTNRSFLYAGTGLSYLHIRARTGGTITASFSDTTAPGVSTVAFRDFSGVDDWGNAGRFWIGTQLSDAWAIEGRYWNMQDTQFGRPPANPAIPTTGTNFATFEESDSTKAYTIDVQAVRSWNCAYGWKTDGFVGARHASFDATSDFLAFGVFTTGNFINLTLQNGSDFDGTGIVYGGTVRHQIGGSHAFFYTSFRTSTLYGQSNSFGRADGTVASSPSAPLVGAATVRRSDADARMYIMELETGVQVEYPLSFLPAVAFFRVGYEMQDWDFDAPPTGGAGFGGTIGEITTNSFASAGIGDLMLQGVTFSTGLTW